MDTQDLMMRHYHLGNVLCAPSEDEFWTEHVLCQAAEGLG